MCVVSSGVDMFVGGYCASGVGPAVATTFDMVLSTTQYEAHFCDVASSQITSI